jgi:hypothetical protein
VLFVEFEFELHSDGTSVGEDGGGGEELQRGASRRGGSGPTAAYHYRTISSWLKLNFWNGDVRRGIPRTPQHLTRVGAAAHERLHQMRTAHRRSPPDQSRTPR